MKQPAITSMSRGAAMERAGELVATVIAELPVGQALDPRGPREKRHCVMNPITGSHDALTLPRKSLPTPQQRSLM
jgi:hypothetical protein